MQVHKLILGPSVAFCSINMLANAVSHKTYNYFGSSLKIQKCVAIIFKKNLRKIKTFRSIRVYKEVTEQLITKWLSMEYFTLFSFANYLL